MPRFDIDAYQRMRTSREVGATVHYSERTGSTMDDARAATEPGGAERCGDAYVAGEQSAGRGRQGRTWVSPPGAALYVTYHLCTGDAARAPLLSIAGALAAADAVSETSGLRTELKWPNDVMRGGRKLAGVLAEARHGARIDVFLGIGINIRAAPGMPADVAATATSIEAAGAPPPAREVLLAALSAALERLVERAEQDPAALIAEWRARLVTLGPARAARDAVGRARGRGGGRRRARRARAAGRRRDDRRLRGR